MQTFLPYENFTQSAKVLDYRRLGKQRIEASQILKALADPTYGWQNHPATKMWRGYTVALIEYRNIIIQEWINRGYKNNMEIMSLPRGVRYPPWLGDERVHSSHRANLLRKDPDWYGQFGWTEKKQNSYYWPV